MKAPPTAFEQERQHDSCMYKEIINNLFHDICMLCLPQKYIKRGPNVTRKVFEEF